MESMDEFDYESVEEILADADCEISAAELHGVICGMVAAGLQLNQSKRWRDSLFELIEGDAATETEVMEITEAIARWTEFEITRGDGLAPLLLPDDSYPPLDQLEAMALWCQGFLLGFGVQNGKQQLVNEEMREAIADLSEISQLELDAEDDEETRQALFTLQEHIRVAVQVIHWEIQARMEHPQSTPGNNTIH